MWSPRPTQRAADLCQLASLLPPLEDPDSQLPTSKRLRLEEPEEVSEATQRLPLLVPRLSEVAKTRELPVRPFEALLVSTKENFDSPVEKSVSGRQRHHLECQNSPFQRISSPQSIPSQHFESGLRASGRSWRQGLSGRKVFGGHGLSRSNSEACQLLSDTSSHDIPGDKNKEGKQYLAQGRNSSQKDNSYIKQAENPFLDGTFYKDAKSTLHEIKNRCKADSATPSNKKENNILPSILNISKSSNQPSLEIAKPCYFRESSTISILKFPTDLNSKMSSIYLKERAKEKNDKNETYVRDFTNVYCSQYKPDVKKQKLQDDNKIVDVENTFSEYCENNHKSLRNQNTCKVKKDLISFNYAIHNSLKHDEHISEKNVTMILKSAKGKETERWLDSYLPTRLENFQSRGYTTNCILKRKRESCWNMNNWTTKCENMKIYGGKLKLQQSLEIGVFNKEDYHNTKTTNTCKEYLKHFVIETQGSKKGLIKIVCISGQKENDNLLPFRYYTTQKGLHLSKLFESFNTEIFCLQEYISVSKKDNSIFIWSETLKCKERIDIQNPKNMNVERHNNVLSTYMQTSVPEILNLILNTNLDSLTKMENELKFGEEYIFKWLADLSFPKTIIMESHSSYQVKILAFSPLLEDNIRPVLKKRKLFQIEKNFEGAKKEVKNSSFSMTTENKCFPIIKINEKIPLLMDFDDMDGSFWNKITTHKDNGLESVLLDGETWAPASASDAKTGPQFTQDYQSYINENIYEINASDIERQQEHKITNFNSEGISEDYFHIKPQNTPASHITIPDQQTNTMTIIQVPKFENFLSEIKGKEDENLKEEIKTTEQSLMSSCHTHKNIKIEKEKKESFSLRNSMFSVHSISSMSKKVNVEDAIQTKQICVNQNNADRHEYESSCQESELVNPKHFHPKNDSTECANHQFEPDLSAGNNECFQNLAAKCLSTEALTIGKDFEMKSKFDLVLEELHMFHEISKEKEILNTVETHIGQENFLEYSNDIEEVEKEIEKDFQVFADMKMCASSSLCDNKAGLPMHKSHQSSFKWKTQPTDGKQEVPNKYRCSGASKEELLYSISEEDCEKPLPQRPALLSDEFKEERHNSVLKGGNSFSHGILRIHPLKTCSRPMRIGLSRKAKLKQLHPYLK
ncbi:RAD51-associated protein 2 [Echinops telfairi]|uniref:RAD51-associated protein 2 n=1 Tax=Echinops telfairi TaxID=9371 RepID=A0ABM0ZPM0_ECHTE|nr:RAD51-associated protein 2 [Echinops telfairi]